MTELEKKCELLAIECAKPLNLEILEVEYVKENGALILRIIAESENGLSIDEATALNEAISNKLDEVNYIDDEYYLEVSSPGIERELKTEKDINKAIGEYVCVYTKDKIENKNETYGYLMENCDESFKLKINLKGRIKQIEIKKENVEKIRMAVKF